MTAAQALANITNAEKLLADATDALNNIRANRKIECSCGKRHAINKLDLLITHWYETPSGCTDGDCWHEGGWEFLCPLDDRRNRLMFDDYDVEYSKRKEFGIGSEPTFKRFYRGLFKSSKDVYERHSNTQFVNNYYIDKNRKKFELPLTRINK